MNGMINVNDIKVFSPMFYASAPCDMRLIGFVDALYDKVPDEEEEI